MLDRNYKYGHLYISPFEGNGKASDARRVTEGEFHVESFDWAPDGSTIVFAHRPDPTFGSRVLHGDISLVDVETGEIRPLITSGGVDSDPHFSPDSRWIAFMSSGDRPEPVGLHDRL